MSAPSNRVRNGLLLAAVIANVVWWGVHYAREYREHMRTSARVWSGGPPDSIAKITLTNQSDRVVINRTPTGWRLDRPAALANTTAVDSLIEAVMTATRVRRIGKSDGAPKSWAGMGFEPPKRVIALLDKYGRTTQLEFGTRDSLDGSLYLRESNGDISLIDGKITYHLDKRADELRDRRFVSQELASFERFTVSRKGVEAYTVERDGDGYIIVAEPPQRANSDQVEGMVHAIGALRVGRFIKQDPGAEDLASHGLDKPSVSIKFEFSPTKPPVIFRFEETQLGDRRTVYAYQEGARSLVALDRTAVFNRFVLSKEGLRDLAVARFDPAAVTSIVVSSRFGTARFAKSGGSKSQNGAWTQLTPLSQPANGPMLEGLIHQVRALRARRVASESPSEADLAQVGVDNNSPSISFFAADDTPVVVLRFGRRVEKEHYVKRDEVSRLDVVFVDDVDALELNPARYGVAAATP